MRLSCCYSTSKVILIIICKKTQRFTKKKQERTHYSNHNAADLEEYTIINPLISVFLSFRMRLNLKCIHNKLFFSEANSGKLLWNSRSTCTENSAAVNTNWSPTLRNKMSIFLGTSPRNYLRERNSLIGLCSFIGLIEALCLCTEMRAQGGGRGGWWAQEALDTSPDSGLWLHLDNLEYIWNILWI